MNAFPSVLKFCRDLTFLRNFEIVPQGTEIHREEYVLYDISLQKNSNYKVLDLSVMLPSIRHIASAFFLPHFFQSGRFAESAFSQHLHSTVFYSLKFQEFSCAETPTDVFFVPVLYRVLCFSGTAGLLAVISDTPPTLQNASKQYSEEPGDAAAQK